MFSCAYKTPSVAHLTIQDAKNEIISSEWKRTLSLAHSHPSLNVFTTYESIASSCDCFWNEALEYGIV